MANEIGDLEYVGRMNPQRLTSLEEDSRTEQAQILADQKRFAKYGTNNPKKAALMAGEKEEELTRERFPEED